MGSKTSALTISTCRVFIAVEIKASEEMEAEAAAADAAELIARMAAEAGRLQQLRRQQKPQPWLRQKPQHT